MCMYVYVYVYIYTYMYMYVYMYQIEWLLLKIHVLKLNITQLKKGTSFEPSNSMTWIPGVLDFQGVDQTRVKLLCFS